MERLLKNDWVVVSNIFYFHPYVGKIHILTNIVQMGWNHELDDYWGESEAGHVKFWGWWDVFWSDGLETSCENEIPRP